MIHMAINFCDLSLFDLQDSISGFYLFMAASISLMVLGAPAERFS